ncbi:RNA polymerase sigma factor SigW [Bacillus sp. THAF10]|uniref:sigma-70 family RNA polymerase sigma factor n=1 Tax=Bacillus sp. THAF10 TaxID=2587848 RepID=UPI0012689928|nr:sigma-70 family RNA polymerase sigma factor [Bacillus sp. THAF10]QFT88565.1 RNA polymerase sigma factor SigW [Bacillus sp. THAF10]
MKDEAAIIQEILSGRKERYQEIIDQYKNRLFSVSYYITGEKEKAESIVSSFFQKIYAALPQYNDTVLFSDWLYQQYISEGIPSDFHVSKYADHSSFHNPRLIEIEEGILELPLQEKSILLYFRILELTPQQISRTSNLEIEEMEAYYSKAMETIRNKKNPLENRISEGGECHLLTELNQYKEKQLGENETVKLEEHLEFCPHCRNLLAGLQREEDLLDEVLFNPTIKEDFSQEILAHLPAFKPKKPKHKTWKYQLRTLGMIGAVVFAISLIYPNIESFSATVKTYLEHGTIYNVWAEGTYAVTDKELTFEVTKIDVDPLHMLLYYDVKREGKSVTINQYEDFDFYSYYPIKIVDEQGKEYPIQLGHPEYLNHGQVAKEVKENYQPYIIIHPKEQENLPDRFFIKVELSKLKGQYGNWDVDIPIHYDKIESSLVKVDLNEKLSFKDKLELELLDITYGKHGAKFRYQVTQTEEEKKRINAYLKEHGQEHRLEEFTTNHHVGIAVMTEDKKHLVPFFFMNEIYDYDQTKPIEMHVSTYYMDQDYHEVKGELDSLNGKLYAEIFGSHYSEPALFSIEVPFEETESTSINQWINGIELIDYQIKQMEENENKYELIIRGNTHDSGENLREIGWQFEDQQGEYLPMEGWYHYEESSKQGVKKLFHGEILTNRDNLETLKIRVDSVYTQFNEHAGRRFPLFIDTKTGDNE